MCSCNHKDALAQALMHLELERDDVLEVTTAHDTDCSIYESRQCCGCLPRIHLNTIWGEFEICTEDGTVRAINLN